MRTWNTGLLGGIIAVALSFGAIACGIEDDGDTTPRPDASVSGSGTIPFMASCHPADDQCLDHLVCFEFNRKGPHCTHACTDDDQCEAPSPGCNGKGVCKAP